MALTEEQLEEIAISVSQRVSCALNFEDATELVRGVIAALPKPDRPSHWEKNDTGEVIPAFGEDCPWGHSPLYRIHTIAPPASEQKPVYQFRPECENWIDCTEQFYESWRGEKRELYTAPRPEYKAQRDAERYRWLCEYLIGPRCDLDDTIISCASKNDMDGVIDAAIASVKGGA